ncbi:hypothetical protein JXA63_05145 [Candidatus Woesebacteria bacterium]|nr:hypothetical protein [Candidatus Woesebacteria bacterium]
MAKKKKNNGDTPVTLELLTRFYKDLLKPEFEKIGRRFDKLEKKIDRNSEQIKENKTAIQLNSVKIDKLDDQFEGLKSDYSDTVSRKEFNQFKAKVLS